MCAEGVAVPQGQLYSLSRSILRKKNFSSPLRSIHAQGSSDRKRLFTTGCNQDLLTPSRDVELHKHTQMSAVSVQPLNVTVVRLAIVSLSVDNRLLRSIRFSD